MKKLKLITGCCLLFSVHSFAQYLEGGQKSFGDFDNSEKRWFFTQSVVSKPLNRNYYNNKIFYRTITLNNDYNNDGTKDIGDYRIRTNNFSNGSSDYLLITVPNVSNYKGSEIEFYSDCFECIALYSQQQYRDIDTTNMFYRQSNIIPTNGTSVRTIESLPFLFQIPKHSAKKSFTIEIGYTIRTAKKRNCDFNQFSTYLFYDAAESYFGPVYLSGVNYLNTDNNCRTSLSRNKTESYKFNWQNEEELDRFIAVYTVEY